MPPNNWTTISIPSPLYHAIQQHVPDLAVSAQAYAAFWLRVGHLVDQAMASTDDVPVNERIVQALQAIGRLEDTG